MFIYTFFGKVLPERAHVTLGPIPRMGIRTILTDGFMDVDAQVVISTAQILVVVHSQNPIDNLESLRNSVDQLVRGLVDAFGYIEGRGYDVEITSVVDSTGQVWRVFPVEITAIQEMKNERPMTLSELCELLYPKAGAFDDESTFRMMQFRLALADLREAIRSIDHTALFCYRAIECLRQCYCDRNGQDNDASRKHSWVQMRRDLCIARSWIDEIEKASIRERHGGHTAMSGEQRAALMLHTWKVVDRFAMSAKLGFQPLSEEVLE